MSCLVTFSVILSVTKEKCSQSLSMSHKLLLWLSNASVFALLINYRTHIGRLLFVSVAAVSNVYSSDHYKAVCYMYACQWHVLSSYWADSPAAGGSGAAAWHVPEIARYHKGSSSPGCHCEMDTSWMLKPVFWCVLKYFSYYKILSFSSSILYNIITYSYYKVSFQSKFSQNI